MVDKEIEVEVRTLNGESIRVSISTTKTIRELKLLLSSSPSLVSSSFHLFFRGIKLNLKSYIHALDIKNGEFLVSVPFTKKDRTETPNSDVSASTAPERSSISGFADAAYSEMMDELSYLSSEATDCCRGPAEDGVTGAGQKRKRNFDNCSDKHEEEGGMSSFLWSVMQSPHKNVLEEQNCERFVKVLESLSCLKVPPSSSCFFLSWINVGVVGACGEDKASCSCPAWLKRIMEAFAFVNIFVGFFQMQMQVITSACLKNALKQLGKFGLKAGFKEIQHLSILCPRVVSFGNKDKPANCTDSIVIIDTEVEGSNENKKDPRNGRRAISFSRIFSGIKKRESSVKTDLTEAFKLLMRKSANIEALLFSVDDLLKVVSEDDATLITGEVKGQLRKSRSESSSSCSSKKRCCDTSQLLAVEMIRHLREGIGSKGQIVHVEDIHPRKATYVEMPNELSERTKSALKGMGITNLYIHQAESILASLAGKNIVVATMTASGKSLCYNVPVLEELSNNFSSCALYLFPTKALAQDQLRALLAMAKGIDDSINIGVYDGDTSQSDRQWLRTNSRLVSLLLLSE